MGNHVYNSPSKGFVPMEEALKYKVAYVRLKKAVRYADAIIVACEKAKYPLWKLLEGTIQLHIWSAIGSAIGYTKLPSTETQKLVIERLKDHQKFIEDVELELQDRNTKKHKAMGSVRSTPNSKTFKHPRLF